MSDLFANDDVEQVAQFKSMYQGYQQHHEVINQVDIDSIDLSTTAVAPILSLTSFAISPNPISDRVLQIQLSAQFVLKTGLQYQIIDMNGTRVQNGEFREHILLNGEISKGVYYLALFEHGRLLSIKPFLAL